MDFYTRNIEFLKDNLSIVYDTVINDEPNFKSKVTLVDSSNIKVEHDHKSCMIHSTYSTERETIEMSSAVDEDIVNLVVFGMGLWYYRDYILDRFKNLKHLIIVEPDINIFKEALHKVNIPYFLQTNVNTTLVVNHCKDEAISLIWSILQLNVTSKMDFAFNLSYRSLYTDYYESLYQGITTMFRRYALTYATESNLLYKCAENTIRNYKQKSIPITKLISDFKSIPIIIVSAGPSLNYNMQYLNEVKDNAVIMAVGSAIKILDSNGIVPHFRLAIDPNEDECRIFEKIDTGNSPLIYVDSLSPGIIEKYKGKKIKMGLDTDYLARYIFKQLFGEEFLIKSGFSVANMALDIAIQLRFKKVIFIGQDLSYTEGSLYAKGSWNQEDGPIDFESDYYIKSTNVIGETVYTDRSFLGMRDLFEKSIRLNPDVSYLNATERGLNIAGAINKPFEKVLEEDLHENRNVVDLINRLILQSQIDDTTWNQKIEKLNFIEIVRELSMINEHRIKKLLKLKRQSERGIGINKLGRDLGIIEAYAIEQLESFEFYQIVVKPALGVKFHALHLKYQYHGSDDKEMFINNLDISIGEATEIKIYLDFLNNRMLE
ncbi:MAG TPA: 6-hydroxymethylpterin diphosphokinase MptE-like protein [Anaerovoracaceae bacterium]|nr:6-hydroxymethylpterin diphosphokinase MptE-like protein [Anaerovoracaceae bacterium]